MRRTRSLRPVAIALAFAFAAAALWLDHARPSGLPGTATVTHVVDGDTVDVTTSAGATLRIRVLGVNTPEIHGVDVPQCFGPEAAAFVQRTTAGAQVSLTYDRVRTDRYGRTLASLTLRSGPLRGKVLTDVLVAQGFGRAMIIPPNGAAVREVTSLEAAARQGRRGLWGAC